MSKNLWDIISNKTAIIVFKKLFNSTNPLSLYELPDDYTITQYRYAINELIEKMILNSNRKGKKIMYQINPFYKNRLKNLLTVFEDLKEITVKSNPLYSILDDFDDWALIGVSALLHLVPILYLTGGKTTICVRNIREKKNIEKYISSDLLRIFIKPRYFIDEKIQWIEGFPVISPEILFFNLLKNQNYRIRLSSLFLLPYISPDKLLSDLYKKKDNSSTIIYLIKAINEYLSFDSANIRIKQWFFNIDQFLNFTALEVYCGIIKTPKQLRSEKKKEKAYYFKSKADTDSKWSALAHLYREETTTFTPDALVSLIGE